MSSTSPSTYGRSNTIRKCEKNNFKIVKDHKGLQRGRVSKGPLAVITVIGCIGEQIIKYDISHGSTKVLYARLRSSLHRPRLLAYTAVRWDGIKREKQLPYFRSHTRLYTKYRHTHNESTEKVEIEN